MNKAKGSMMFLFLLFCVLFSAMWAEAKVKVQSVKVKSNYGKIVHVGKGKKVRVTVSVKVRPNRSSWKGIRYRSKNKRIAKVNAIGQITGRKLGTTRIYAISKKNKKKRSSIKVKVVKPLKKIILRETEKTLKIGETFTVKRTVVPSDSGFKRLRWNSSAPSVVKVSSTGVVTAVAPGNAKVTAEAVDGSGTKAVCEIKVQSADTVNISSVKALSSNTVRVTFDREVPLEKSAFGVTGKTNAFGGYNRCYKVLRMRNYGNTTYDLRIQQGSTIEKNSFIRVSVNGLPGNGVKYLEASVSFVKESAPPDKYVMGDAGDYIDPVEFDLSRYGYGSLVYHVGSLPEGIQYEIKDNTIVFSGRTSRSYYGKTTTITATDEMENEISANVYWYIGSDDTMVGYADGISLTAGEKLEEEKGNVLHVTGGSGQYKYEFSGLPQGIEGDSETGQLSGSCQITGEYKVKVTIEDKGDKSRKITVSLELGIESGFNIFGRVSDSQGQGMSGITVWFEDETGRNSYTAVTDMDGNYSLRAVKGVYQGKAVTNQQDLIWDDIYAFSLGADSRIDFFPECYRVKINYDEAFTLGGKMWYSAKDKSVGYDGDGVIYVMPGKYDIYTTAFKIDKDTGKEIKYILRAEFTVLDTGISTETEAVVIKKEETEKEESEKSESEMEEN